MPGQRAAGPRMLLPRDGSGQETARPVFHSASTLDRHSQEPDLAGGPQWAQGQGLGPMDPDWLSLSSHSVRHSREGASTLVSIPTLQPPLPASASQDFTKGSEMVACSQAQWWTPVILALGRSRREDRFCRPACATWLDHVSKNQMTR